MNRATASLGKSRGLGTIRNDDAFPEVSVSDASANERDGMLVFDITLSRATEFPVTVTASIAAGTASPDIDFRPIRSQLVEFAANTTKQTVAVPILDDQLDEADETIIIELSNPSASRISKGRAIQ